ncbi:MAG: ArsR/SmtB family transcription factor [Ilumatobacter sp.]|uniref:ArsR/SmtB family transcription factor n=1 Tax=Ilumatobacter sp. TaxID=1967498 RepID=UPI00391A4585
MSALTSSSASNATAIATAATAGSCCGGADGAIDHDEAVVHAARLAALADPTRLQIVSIIANAPAGEVCACDFVRPLNKSQPTISHHLKVLSMAGLVEGDKRGRWVWYRLALDGIAEVQAMLDSITSGIR